MAASAAMRRRSSMSSPATGVTPAARMAAATAGVRLREQGTGHQQDAQDTDRNTRTFTHVC
jgi:hypothetical protein